MTKCHPFELIVTLRMSPVAIGQSEPSTYACLRLGAVARVACSDLVPLWVRWP